MATIFACGAECGMVTTGSAAGGVKHWDTLIGTVAADTNTFRSPGLRSYRFDCNGSASRLQKNTVSTPAVGVARCYVRFGSLPTADAGILSFFAGSVEFGVFFDQSQGGLNGKAGSTEGVTAVPVVVNTWYRVDLRVDVSANPQLVDYQIDGVAQTQLSRAQAATTLADYRIGCGTQNVVVTGTTYIDDLLVSVTTGDYPLGAGVIVGRPPAADGAHSFNAATDFKYNNTTNIATTATDTFSYLDDPLTAAISDFLAAAGNTGGEYLEWNIASLPGDVSTVNGVEVVSAHHASGTAANTQSLRIVDGASTTNILSDADMSVTGKAFNSTHLATKPSGGAWTKSTVEGVKVRWSSSFTTPDISPVPFIDELTLEVAYVQVAATPWQLQKASACYTVDHLILFNVQAPGENPPGLGGGGSASYIRRMGLRQHTDWSHRFGFSETEDR